MKGGPYNSLRFIAIQSAELKKYEKTYDGIGCLRFGVGDNFPKGRQVDYVLSGFDDDEQPELPALVALG